MTEKKKIVGPGEFISHAEEMAEGPGAHQEQDGIYSSIYGELDTAERTASVKGGKTIIDLKRGMVVYGVVTMMLPSKALVEMNAVGLEKGKRALIDDVGVLKVSDISEDYIESIKDAIRIGDVVRARVTFIGGSNEISIKGPEYGVVKAYCVKCRHPMELKDKLVCSNCGHIEKRKLAAAYGKAPMEELFQ